MGKPLTKLQRIAISYFLIQSIRGNYDVYRHLYDGGKILFNRNLHGGYNMFVQVANRVPLDKEHYRLTFMDLIIMQFEESENIDVNIEYSFKYDGDMMFHITEINYDNGRFQV